MNEFEKKIDKYANVPQLLFGVVRPRVAYLRWARGTGKTEFPICHRMHMAASLMPRSNNFFAVPSYNKFLKDLLPAIRKGLTNLGYQEYDPRTKKNKGHWTIGLKPPKHWAKPIYTPDVWDNVISFANGTIYSLFSQDSKMKNQGNSLISGIADEAKLINKDRLNEDCIKAMRGGSEFWGHLPEFNSLLYTSDGYLNEKCFNWFIEDESQANAEEMEMMIRLSLAAANGKLDKAGKQALDYARKNVMYYNKASGFENRYALGQSYFKRAYEQSSPMEFLVSNLNYDMNRIEGSFYRHMDEVRHGRFAAIESYWQNMEYMAHKIDQATCLGDSDINYSLPLDLSFDFGGQKNCAVVGQFDKPMNTYNLLKDFVAGKFEEIVGQFDAYYHEHKRTNGTVDLWYDVSGTYEQANSYYTYCDEIKMLLQRLGWNVNLPQPNTNYLNHNLKFLIWDKVLYEGKDRDPRFPIFRFNRTNAKKTALSMGLAPAKDNNGKIQKDKSSEKRKSVAYEKATHLSDAIDNPICFRFKNILERKTEFIKI
jgi:hypothetical protein